LNELNELNSGDDAARLRPMWGWLNILPVCIRICMCVPYLYLSDATFK